MASMYSTIYVDDIREIKEAESFRVDDVAI